MMPHDINVFGLASLPNPVSDAYWNGVFHTVHRYACMTLFLLVTLHVAAVIHHRRNGRNVLARML
jgi:cytochrome b561